ncbi:hypothetical protein NMG60_11003850 [Bertholletia excelsa]
MDKEEKNQRVLKPPETDFLLQWGSRKKLRCVRFRDPEMSDPSNAGGRIRRKITSRVVNKDVALLQPPRFTRNPEAATFRSENRKSSASPEKEERYYTTRGSAAAGVEENGKFPGEGGERGIGEENRGLVWPKLYITLSSKEKEEDFMAMKGCKPPQRPKKRAKTIQRILLLVSPGAWLTDMCQERYEVREKKSTKKRPRGLKAMGSMESDSE